MIPQIEPFIDQEELDQLKRVVASTFVTESKLTEEFEEFFRQYTGSKNVVAYANGTLALFGILKALGIGPGDEVIVPDLTFIATANSVILAGAKPVFCDIEKETLGLDLNKASKLVTERTKAMIPVHLYGLAADVEKMGDFCREHNLQLIEDAAQGVGVRRKQRHVGTFGHAGFLSFYGNKTITCGEGGIVLTDDPGLAKACYRLKNHGRDRKGVFVHDSIGFNFSFTEMQAAVGLSQCSKLPRIIEKKKYIYDFYRERLESVEELRFLTAPRDCDPVYWFTNIFVESAEDLSQFLMTQGVGSRRFFYPLHLQPCYHGMNGSESCDFSVCLEMYKTGLSLPSSYNLDDGKLEQVVQAIRKYFKQEQDP